MLEQRRLTLPDQHPEADAASPVVPLPEHLSGHLSDPLSDRALFRLAMADVTPLRHARRAAPRPGPALHAAKPRPLRRPRRNQAEAILALQRLVDGGAGFVVADTPEYIEGTRYCDNPEIARRLHNGDYSIQAHIDLHGMRAADAEAALEAFLKDAVATGKRAVSVIHGRGLSSPHRPVLKTLVQEWLTRGPWRKWVIAYASAPGCDGGAGATYALLRREPVTRRFRKKGRRQGATAPRRPR